MRNSFRIIASRTTLMLALLCLSAHSFAQGQPDIEKLADEEVDEADITYAQKMADEIITMMAEGGFYEFTEENAIPQLVQGFTEDVQKQAYQQIKTQVGDYQPSTLDYQEAHHLQQGEQEAIIYRFKGDFANSTPEVRVVLTPDNKLAGLQVIPWNDQLQ